MKGSDISVAIFWDYENCPIPKNASGYAIASRISTLARPYGSVKVFQAYLDISKHRFHNLRSELQSCGVSLVDCPHNGRKEVADKMILADMLVYAIDNPAPSTFVLITGDRDFSYVLSILKRRQYDTVLVTLPDAHPSLTNQARTCFDWIDGVLNQAGSQAESSRLSDRAPHNMSIRHPSRARPSQAVDSLALDTDTEGTVDIAYHSRRTRRQVQLSRSPSLVRTKSDIHREGAISPNKVALFPLREGASISVVDPSSVDQIFGRTGSTLESDGEKTSEDSSCFSPDSPTNDLRFTMYEHKKREILNKAKAPAIQESPSSLSAVPPTELELAHGPPLLSAVGIQYISSSSPDSPAGSHATSAPSPPVIPPIFIDLVQVLQRHRSKRIYRSFQSVVASRMKKWGTYKTPGMMPCRGLSLRRILLDEHGPLSTSFWC